MCPTPRVLGLAPMSGRRSTRQQTIIMANPIQHRPLPRGRFFRVSPAKHTILWGVRHWWIRLWCACWPERRRLYPHRGCSSSRGAFGAEIHKHRSWISGLENEDSWACPFRATTITDIQAWNDLGYCSGEPQRHLLEATHHVRSAAALARWTSMALLLCTRSDSPEGLGFLLAQPHGSGRRKQR